MYEGCAGKTVRSLENACHTWVMCSRWSAIKIHVYLYLYFQFQVISLFINWCCVQRWSSQSVTHAIHSALTSLVTPMPGFLLRNWRPKSLWCRNRWVGFDSMSVCVAAQSFVHGNNLYYQASPTVLPVQLTTSGDPLYVFNGVPDWLYEGYWQ